MNHSDLKGIICASTTPISPEFEIDSERLASHCEVLIANGCSFISTFGTTGEGASFSTRQKTTALRELKAQGTDMSRQIPSIMTPSYDEAGSLIKEIAALGCRAALVLPPFYYSDISMEGIHQFFDEMLNIADRPDIDVLLYNIPQFSHIGFTTPLIEFLINKFGDTIVGIKDSTGSLENGLMLTGNFPNLSVFTGDDRVMPPLVEAGGAGMIGGLPNVFSKDLRQVYDRLDTPAAAPLKSVAAKRIELVDRFGGLVALKALLAKQYDDDNWLRAVPPLVGLSQLQQNAVLAAFEQINIEEAHQI